MQVATKNGIRLRLFCGDNLNSKNFKKLILVEWRFNIRQESNLQFRTLLNSIRFHESVFNCVKYIVDFPFHKVARIQSTVYLLDCPECSERKGCSKISKTQKKKKKTSQRNCPLFSNATALQSTIPVFSKCGLQQKYFLWVLWYSWKFARKRSIMKSFH